MRGTLQLLITLVGVTLLFACIQQNGTLEAVVSRALRFGYGRRRLMAPSLFLLTAAASAIGPGGIPATALIAPFAMKVAPQVGVTTFLASLMVCHGAMAGFLSPFSTTGAVANALMQRAGLGGHQFRMWFIVGAAHLSVAAAGYVLCGGWKPAHPNSPAASAATPPLQVRHWFTIGVTAAWMAASVGLRWSLGWSAATAAAVLLLTGLASAREAIKRMPWKVIVLVVAISSLVSAAERVGVLEWLKDALPRIATPTTVYALIAFFGGIVSAYSSTTAVVLPAFLPLVPGMAARFVAVDPVALSTSLLIGATLVDVSPLSTLGALCVAAAPKDEASSRNLFRSLLLWGLCMALVAAAICYVASPVFVDG